MAEMPKTIEVDVTYSLQSYSVADRGHWVDLLVQRAVLRKDAEKRTEDLMEAQGHLDAIQAHIDSLRGVAPESVPTPTPCRHPAIIPTLREAVEMGYPAVALPEPEPTPTGPVRDADGNVTRISAQPDQLGYDPDISSKEGLKIFCDNQQIENAHTADTVEGLVLYYKKNDKGRIKTHEVRGKVEIRGI